MMGLLDQVTDDPSQMGLLSMGLRLMSTPGKFGTAFGQAGLGAIDDMTRAKMQAQERKNLLQREQLMAIELERQKAMQQAAMVAAARKAKDDQLLSGAFRQMPGPQPDGTAGVTPRFDLQGLIGGGLSMDSVPEAIKLQQLLNPQRKLTAYKPGDQVRDEAGNVAFEVPTAPEKPDPSPVEKLMAARDKWPTNSPQWKILNDALTKATTHAPAATQNNFGPPVQGIDAAGNPVFVQPTKDGSAPNIIPGVRPPKSAAEEKAAGEKRDRDRQGQQMMSVMGDSRKILEAGRATESGLGNVVDAAGRMVGVSRVAAQDAARLEAMSGWLVANVPRMEGPQSNFDVQNYVTMAGKVGDRTVPISERLAALAEVENLQRKYADINGTPAAPAGKPKRGDVVDGYRFKGGDPADKANWEKQ